MSIVSPYYNRNIIATASPQPYYYNGGRYIFFDGFEDGLLRWSQSDDHPEANGFTGITSIMTRGNASTKALFLGSCITGSTTNQDACMDLGIAYPPTAGSPPYNPIIGIEFWLCPIDFLNAFSVSIERSDGIINKTEWKWTYNAQSNPRQWQQVTSNPSPDTANNIFSQQLRPHNVAGITGFTPVKIYVDTGNTGSANSTKIFSGNESAFGPYVPNTFSSSLLTPGHIRIEFSVIANSLACIGDYLVDDVWISIEDSIP